MTNKQIAQAYAEGKTTGHASNRTLFIDGDTVYSYGYHFAIARRIAPNKYLFTKRKYSSTTGRHKHHVLMALTSAGHEIEEVERLES